jgi:hypothetical protein
VQVSGDLGGAAQLSDGAGRVRKRALASGRNPSAAGTALQRALRWRLLFSALHGVNDICDDRCTVLRGGMLQCLLVQVVLIEL